MAGISEPLYLRIYNYLMEAIQTKKIDERHRLPSEKELSEMFHVSRITSKRALEMLASDGTIVRIPGKGSFISKGENSSLARQNMPASKKLCLGVIIPDISESYGIGLISGIESACEKENILYVSRRSHGDRKLEEAAINEFLEFGVDGIIIMPVHGEYYNPQILKLILENFPLVVMDRQMTGIDASFVGSDNVAAAYQAIEYLFEQGHQNICFLSPPYKNNMAISKRIEGIVSCYSHYGVTLNRDIWLNNITCTLPGHNQPETIKADIQEIQQHMREKPQISAVFAAEYNIALLAQEALRLSGRKVPEDVSILSFDSPGNFIDRYQFTHIRQRDEFVGQKAVELTLSQIRGDQPKKKGKILVPTDLKIGMSTRRIGDSIRKDLLA